MASLEDLISEMRKDDEALKAKLKTVLEAPFLWFDQIDNDLKRFEETGILEYSDDSIPPVKIKRESAMEKRNKPKAPVEVIPESTEDQEDKENDFKLPEAPIKKKTKKETKRKSSDVEEIREKISIVNLTEEVTRCTRSKTRNAKTTETKTIPVLPSATVVKSKAKPSKRISTPSPVREPDPNATYTATSADSTFVKTTEVAEQKPPVQPSKVLPNKPSTPIKTDSRPTKETQKDTKKLQITPTAKQTSKLPLSATTYRLRELGAIKKKESHLQAQSEEIKRRLEERHQKAKQCRMELEEAKLEKLKQTLAEKEKKQQTPLQARLQEKRKLETKIHDNIPIYMRMKMPLLPTADCYDSDDERGASYKPIKRDWETSQSINNMLELMEYVSTEVYQNLFKPKQPDLVEIFQRDELRKIKRTSSAVWNTPPLSSKRFHDSIQE